MRPLIYRITHPCRISRRPASSAFIACETTSLVADNSDTFHLRGREILTSEASSSFFPTQTISSPAFAVLLDLPTMRAVSQKFIPNMMPDSQKNCTMSIQEIGDERIRLEEFWVSVTADNETLSKVSCQWSFSKLLGEDLPRFFHSVELLMTITPATKGQNSEAEDSIVANNRSSSVVDTTVERLVRKCCELRPASLLQKVVLSTKIILVAHGGYLCRLDILELRMRHSDLVEAVIQLPTADGYFPSLCDPRESNLAALLASSPGVLLLRDKPETPYRHTFKSLDDDIAMRLSFDWILPTKPPTRKAAMIGGRAMFDPKKKSFCYQGPYEAAHALGISVIVVDKPGHWLQESKYSHLREAFIAIDMTIDDALASRITEAVQGMAIDGIVAFADEFLDATVQAAQRLGLPTDAVSAYVQSLDKYSTRKLVNPDVQALCLDNANQLDEPAVIPQIEALAYPVIVKPRRGGGSRGISKVVDFNGLRQAAHKAGLGGYSSQSILVEPYADGPEVDANFALWDGEILFFEMCDDFPCAADAEDAMVTDNFAEDNMILSSGLDPAEKELVKSTLHNTLLRLGFRSGVFHVEARIQNSTMRYEEVEGIVDLKHIDVDPQAVSSCRKPEVFLLEVNPRPAGPQSVYATSYTYGVDFYGLQWLRVLDSGDRFASLCHPFTCHAQYCSSILMIPVHRDNINVPIDYCDEILRRLPDVAPYVSRTECFTPGTIVSQVKGAGFLAYFLVYSKTSRRALLEMCDRIKKVSKGLLDGV